MTNEIWAYISGQDGYEISTSGRVRRGGKVLKPAVTSNGYLRVTVRIDGVRKPENIHRLVAAAFIKRPFGKKWVLHKDDNKTNNCVENLYWGDSSDNHKDRVSNGRAKWRCKLQKPDILYLRTKVKNGGFAFGEVKALAALYGVSDTTIWRAARGRSHNHSV
jgi:hypothetical protein